MSIDERIKYIQDNFYVKQPEETLIEMLLNFSETPLDISQINDSGPEVQPILSSWVDDLLYQAKRINNVKSPDEALQSPDDIAKILEYVASKPKFYTGDDISNVKSYFRNSQSSVVNASKVANFSPSAARKIYERYCPQFYATVLDYSSGWMARMLGCLTSPYQYQYIGIEPNTKLNQRLHDFSEWICKNLNRPNNTKLYIEGSEVFHPELVNQVDISFSSPPYFNLEIYTDEQTQSANKNTSYIQWLHSYMIPTINNIYQYTKPNGIHIVNLKNLTTAGHEPLLDDWIRACKLAGFKLVDATYLTHQSRRQFDKNKSINFNADKEPIIIFKKIIS